MTSYGKVFVNFLLITCIQSFQNKLPSSQETTFLDLGNKTTWLGLGKDRSLA